MIKAIFFDASETLIHLPRGVAAEYAFVAKRHGIKIAEQKLNTAFRSVWKTRPVRVISDAARPDDDKGWWRELVSEVLAQCGVMLDETKTAALFEDLYAHFALPGVWELYPDVLPALHALRGKFSLGVISNFDRRLYAIFEQLGIRDYFDAIVISSEAGADKPHPQIFRRALDSLRIPASAALHVGDDPLHDWQGAESAGLQCYRLNRRENSLHDLAAFALRHRPTSAT